MARKPKAEQDKPAEQEGTVKMVRSPEQFPPPHEIDVHPAEVENYAAGGWVVKD